MAVTLISGPMIESAEVVEEHAEAVSSRVSYIVEVTGFNTVGDIFAAAMTSATLPSPRQPTHGIFSGVLVTLQPTRRTYVITAWDGTKAKVRVDIESEQFRLPSDSLVPISGGASLSQIKTQKDRNEEAIKVTHKGQTVVVEADVLEPQGHTTRERTIPTRDPEGEVALYIGHVNSTNFLGGEPRQWLCIRVDYDLIARGPGPDSNVYKFTYEFERRNRADGWRYVVVFKEADGNIPSDLIIDSGIKIIDWHRERNFASEFAFT